MGSGPDGLTFRAPLPITPGTMRPALRLVETPRRREAQRRRTDRAHSSVPADRLAAARGRKPKPPTGPTLRTQVVGPFGLGMAAGVPTLLLTVYQGLPLGAFVALHYNRALAIDFLGWLAIHGVTELGALIRRRPWPGR